MAVIDVDLTVYTCRVTIDTVRRYWLYRPVWPSPATNQELGPRERSTGILEPIFLLRSLSRGQL